MDTKLYYLFTFELLHNAHRKIFDKTVCGTKFLSRNYSEKRPKIEKGRTPLEEVIRIVLRGYICILSFENTVRPLVLGMTLQKKIRQVS